MNRKRREWETHTHTQRTEYWHSIFLFFLPRCNHSESLCRFRYSVYASVFFSVCLFFSKRTLFYVQMQIGSIIIASTLRFRSWKDLNLDDEDIAASFQVRVWVLIWVPEVWGVVQFPNKLCPVMKRSSAWTRQPGYRIPSITIKFLTIITRSLSLRTYTVVQSRWTIECGGEQRFCQTAFACIRNKL